MFTTRRFIFKFLKFFQRAKTPLKILQPEQRWQDAKLDFILMLPAKFHQNVTLGVGGEERTRIFFKEP